MGCDVALSTDRFQVVDIEGSTTNPQRLFVVNLGRQSSTLAAPVDGPERFEPHPFPPRRTVDSPGCGVHEGAFRSEARSSLAPERIMAPASLGGLTEPPSDIVETEGLKAV